MDGGQASQGAGQDRAQHCGRVDAGLTEYTDAGYTAWAKAAKYGTEGHTETSDVRQERRRKREEGGGGGGGESEGERKGKQASGRRMRKEEQRL
jgi:hypothetical protein